MSIEDDAMDRESTTGTGHVVGHFVVAQMSGHKKDMQLESLVGIFHYKHQADAFAAKDRGLKVFELETLG